MQMLKKSIQKNILYCNIKQIPVTKKLTHFLMVIFIKNPKANKIERRNAIKKFLNTTRNVN